MLQVSPSLYYACIMLKVHVSFFPAIGCWVWKTRYWVSDLLILNLTDLSMYCLCLCVFVSVFLCVCVANCQSNLEFIRCVLCWMSCLIVGCSFIFLLVEWNQRHQCIVLCVFVSLQVYFFNGISLIVPQLKIRAKTFTLLATTV